MAYQHPRTSAQTMSKQKHWLSIYLQHARNYAHQENPPVEVVSHLWQMGWREDWGSLLDYLRQSLPPKIIKAADQWALNMVLLPVALAQHEAWLESGGAERRGWRPPGYRYKGGYRYRPKEQAEFAPGCVDLRGALFNNANLSYIYFRKTKLEGALFHNTDLSMTHFKRLNLTDAKFQKTKINRTLFDRSIINRTCFKNENLSKAYITCSTFKEADFRGTVLSNLHRSELIQCKISSTTQFRGGPNSHPYGTRLIED